MKIRLSKPVKTAIKIVLSLAALLFVFTKIDIEEVLAIYRKSNLLYVLIAVLLFTLSKFIAALRLNRFFASIGIKLSESYNLRLYLLGMFYNLFLPGGIGGDGYKIYLLNKKHDVKAGKIFWAVFHDRLSGVLALFCLAVILSLFITINIPFDYKKWMWLLVPLAISLLYFLLRKFWDYFSRIYPRTTSYSFMVQLIQTLCAFFIFRAIGGSNDVAGYLFIFLISSIVAMMPITIGGVGSREITFLYGSMWMGLDENLSIAMSLMFYLITAFVSFFGLFYSIRGRWEDEER